MTRDQQHSAWRKCLNDFEESGLNARQFCMRENLKYPKFLRWKKQLTSTQSPENIFEEIGLSGEISLTAGSLKIQVNKDIDCTSLSQVISALCAAAR